VSGRPSAAIGMPAFEGSSRHATRSRRIIASRSSLVRGVVAIAGKPAPTGEFDVLTSSTSWRVRLRRGNDLVAHSTSSRIGPRRGDDAYAGSTRACSISSRPKADSAAATNPAGRAASGEGEPIRSRRRRFHLWERACPRSARRIDQAKREPRRFVLQGLIGHLASRRGNRSIRARTSSRRKAPLDKPALTDMFDVLARSTSSWGRRRRGPGRVEATTSKPAAPARA
jgi:hypothetical protein